MTALKKTSKIVLGHIATVLSFSAFAVTVTPSSLSIPAGGSRTVQLVNISGSVLVQSSNSGIATVKKMDSTNYQVNGLKAGSVVLEFKDRKSSSKVNVTVTTNAAATLNGRLLASNCFQCHGTNGSSGAFDALAGDGSADTYNKLKEFAAKASSSNNVMAAHATGYTDAQMKQIAAYFASIR